MTNPGSLVGVPDVAPFLDSEFTHAVRNGYRFTFAGESETTGGQRLYRDYSYVAVPTADGPAERRSFAVYDDGVVRVRTDGRTPLETDPPVTR